MEKESYNIDRKAASRLLKVSIRTLDRYIKSKKLSSKAIDGRIWLNRKELRGFGAVRKRGDSSRQEDLSMSPKSIENSVDKTAKIEMIDVDKPINNIEIKKNLDQEVYEKLFLQLKEELKEKQERLELANYRVGQLEAQVRNSIPILEYKSETYKQKKKTDDLTEKLIESTDIIKSATSSIRYERFLKKIYITILIIILSLQPLWLLLINPFE